jgi:hypothetical protein
MFLTLLLLRSVVDVVHALFQDRRVLRGETIDDRRGERRLAVVDVTGSPDVDVRLVALEFCLRHDPVILSFMTALATAISLTAGC